MKGLGINTEYAAAFGAYWMIYAITGSFASVFMLAKGYNNTHIGMTLAAANLIALLLQPFVADRMDRTRGIKIIDPQVWLTLIMMMIGAGFFVFGGGTFLLASVIVLVLAIHSILQPLLNTLAFRLSESGVKVSFGIGRAGGSLGYSVIMAVLGTLVERKGEMAIPFCSEAACAMFMMLLLLTKYSFNRIKRESDAETYGRRGDAEQVKPINADEERIDLSTFIRRNRHFFIMNLGIAGLLFSNSLLSNYMPQIAANVNGTTEQVGRILSLMALSEIPMMLFYDRINRHFSNRGLIKVATIGLTAKITACWLARSVGLLFAAQILQLIGFALLMPAMVYFINEIMSPGEAVKGQALFTMMLTLSTIIASIAGGWTLDMYGVRTMLFIATVMTVAGAAVVILNLNKIGNH